MKALLPLQRLIYAARCSAIWNLLAPRNSCHDAVLVPAQLLPRLEVMSQPNASLACADEGSKFQAGYAHFMNSSGTEDKHMFWWLFEARRHPENAPVVLMFGGGPGTTGLANVFFGAGPCSLISGNDGQGEFVPSLYPWTEEVNVLAIDQPASVGFSYSSDGALINSSAQAAVDVDDFLQSFWGQYPQLIDNKFLIQSGSYGGTYIPHIVDVIHRRNRMHERSGQFPSRVIKMPESIMMSNVWSDALTYFRWFVQSNCVDNVFFNESVCDNMITKTPGCLDAVQLAYEQSTLQYRKEALIACGALLSATWTGTTDRNPADVRVKCSTFEDCYPQFVWFVNAMNSTALRDAIGVHRHVPFSFLENERVGNLFSANGDSIQPAYLLLKAAIEDGLRVLVVNGNKDGLCPWRSNVAWMKLFQTKYQTQFREAEEIVYPGVGYVQQAGPGAGDYTFLRITESGHFIEMNQPEVVRHILLRWINNEPFF